MLFLVFLICHIYIEAEILESEFQMHKRNGSFCYFRVPKSFKISHLLQNKRTKYKPPPTVRVFFTKCYFSDWVSLDNSKHFVKLKNLRSRCDRAKLKKIPVDPRFLRERSAVEREVCHIHTTTAHMY